MTRRKSTTTVAATLLGLVLCVPALAQEHKPKLAELITIDADIISVDGFWEPDNPTKPTTLVPVSHYIECFRHGGTNFVRTDAFCVDATAMSVSGTLKANFSFQEAVWSDDEISVSDDSSICVVSKTFFDLKRKTVAALDIRKPEAKGLGDACKILPDRQSYYLREIVDYTPFHGSVKK
jgi:hypothetical protein